jgi:hypothetical protein
VKFYNGGDKIAAPNQGQVFSYFGKNIELFERVFRAVGDCFRLSAAYEGGKGAEPPAAASREAAE